MQIFQLRTCFFLFLRLFEFNFIFYIQQRLLFLQRSDVDTSLKDFEGYTAFDLYNSTVNDTKPDANDFRAELFTWGTNRYAGQP